MILYYNYDGEEKIPEEDIRKMFSNIIKDITKEMIDSLLYNMNVAHSEGDRKYADTCADAILFLQDKENGFDAKLKKFKETLNL